MKLVVQLYKCSEAFHQHATTALLLNAVFQLVNYQVSVSSMMLCTTDSGVGTQLACAW